ncbi:hypothetical protein AC578_1826 [Pseudocercospora eumusae]|uniref:F-box domain-containing protein n=1 Tax=Pseudocercospora eumusae TaxID=321146 RepID=A0A139HKA0_9PEZI|nr:hypothetical protein AC578_1826 [Pseudocercospora eumusae]
MNTLPEELLALICDTCDHASNKTLRLVERRFEAASTPLVFEHFYMGVFEYGLEKLNLLTKSPLAKHVKKFTIFSDILPGWEKEAWRRRIDLRPDFLEWCPLSSSNSRQAARLEYDALPRHDLTFIQLFDAWRAYLFYLREQREWRQDQHGVRLKELISSLPNLTEAHVKCTVPFTGGTNKWPVWKGLLPHIKVGPDNWRWEARYFDPNPNYARSRGHAALALTEAVGYRATFFGIKPISKLEIQSSHLGSYQDLFEALRPRSRSSAFNGSSGFEDISGSLTHQGRAHHSMRVDGFRSLTSLKLHMPHATLSSRLHGVGLELETLQFLRAAHQLRELDLRYTDDELRPDMHEEMPQLEGLFASDEPVWPHLGRLALATNLNAEILLKFLRNHSLTLKELELRDMSIKGVRLLVEEIPKVLQLRHVYMECLWDESPSGHFLSVLSRGTDWEDPYELGVRSYLLRKLSVMPALTWDGGNDDNSETHL